MAITTKKISTLTNVGTIQDGDILVGQRVNGTPVNINYAAAGGNVDSVNGQTGVVVIDPDDLDDTSTTNKFTDAADIAKLAAITGTNTGDQTSIVGITGTKAQFDTAVTDGNILYVGDAYVPGGTDVAVADGGTGTSSAGITAFNNITGYTAAGSTGTTSTNLVFSTSPALTTPSLGVASATSINFGQDALNYYDEGTFTPTWTYSTPGDISVVYTTQDGQYTRIGNRVYITLKLSCTPTFSTASGTLRIGGLPFTSSAFDNALGAFSHNANLTYPASRTMPAASIPTSVSYLNVLCFGNGAGSSGVTTAQTASGSAQIVYVNMTYYV